MSGAKEEIEDYKSGKAARRLIQKTQRQLKYCVNTPPRSGPTPAEMAQTRPVVAKNMPRWLYRGQLQPLLSIMLRHRNTPSAPHITYGDVDKHDDSSSA